MGRTESIPGLDPKDPRQVYFPSEPFDALRRELEHSTTIGQQHALLERLFLATKLVTIGGNTFDTMPRPSKAYNCDDVPAIRDAGIVHTFSWLASPLGDGWTTERMPKLSVVTLPRTVPKMTARKTPQHTTKIMYEFTDGELTGARTADLFCPTHFSHEPGQPVKDTLFAALGDYVCRRIETQLVVVAGNAYFDKPEHLPEPIPYTHMELRSTR